MRIIKHFIINRIFCEGIRYPTPINLNYFWSFGFLAFFYLAVQIVTGILLAIHYTPSEAQAYESVLLIMRDVNYGSFLRYAHSNGASMFLGVLYLHIAKALYIYSFVSPRVAVWLTGVVLFLLICATAFTGYVLPWGQMSFWGATVIINFFTAIPVYGDTIAQWVLGGYTVGDATIKRFYLFHIIAPFIILALSVFHIILLHKVGSSNPTAVDRVEAVPFFPYFFLKDLQVLNLSLMLFLLLVCFMPDLLGHSDNYIKANPLQTPKHIVPEWYFLPFYAILRSIPSKVGGVLCMLASFVVWFIIPLYKTVVSRAVTRLPIYNFFVYLFFVSFILLGWVGSKKVSDLTILIGQICTVYYFFYFLIFLPIYPYFDEYYHSTLSMKSWILYFITILVKK